MASAIPSRGYSSPNFCCIQLSASCSETIALSLRKKWLRAGILSRETYLVYPISPRVLLYCHPRHGKFRKLSKFADCLSPVPLDAGMVESENSGQVFMGSRFVFSSRSQFDAERAFAKTIGTDLYASDHVRD